MNISLKVSAAVDLLISNPLPSVVRIFKLDIISLHEKRISMRPFHHNIFSVYILNRNVLFNITNRYCPLLSNLFYQTFGNFIEYKTILVFTKRFQINQIYFCLFAEIKFEWVLLAISAIRSFSSLLEKHWPYIRRSEPIYVISIFCSRNFDQPDDRGT